MTFVAAGVLVFVSVFTLIVGLWWVYQSGERLRRRLRLGPDHYSRRGGDDGRRSGEFGPSSHLSTIVRGTGELQVRGGLSRLANAGAGMLSSNVRPESKSHTC